MGERLDGYVRVSRIAGRAGDSYISPSVQREAIQRWADYKGIEIAEWHVDEDWSGGSHQRPGLEAAVRRALAGETGGIVSWKIDRFSRQTEGALRDLRRLEEVGARLAFVVEDIDTGTTYGRMIYTIMLAVSEAFLANIKAGWAVTKQRAVARGAYVSRTPWGYQRNDDGTLSPHPERAEIVSEAFQLAAAGTLQSAMAYLVRVAPERNWNATKVRRLLSQRSYLGETRNGDIVQAGTHEALVSRPVWEAAQSTPAHRRPAEHFPLSGLARCATCGQPMIGGRGGTGQRTYRCSSTTAASRYGRKRCEQGAAITATILEEHVRDALRPAWEGLQATVSDPIEDEAFQLVSRTLADAEAELTAFAADLTLRKALGAHYHQHLQGRVNAVEKARKAYREHARSAQVALTLRLSDAEQDPELWPIMLGGMFESIRVRPGRGPVSERVEFVPLEGDLGAGIPNLEGS